MAADGFFLRSSHLVPGKGLAWKEGSAATSTTGDRQGRAEDLRMRTSEHLQVR